MLRKYNRSLYALLFFLSMSLSAADISVKGLIEGGYVKADYDQPWLNSWMDEGVGILRF
ncbi:MAG: hypothetical protein ACI9YH_004435, partial [Colwellia sp.]